MASALDRLGMAGHPLRRALRNEAMRRGLHVSKAEELCMVGLL